MNELQKALLPLIIFPIIFSFIVISIMIYIIKKDKLKNNSFRKKILKKYSSLFNHDELEYIYQKNVETSDVSNIKKEKFINFMKSLVPYFFIIQLIFFIIYALIILKSGDKDKFEKIIFFSSILLIVGFAIVPKKKYIEYKEKIIKQFLNAIHPEINYDSNHYECIEERGKSKNTPFFSNNLQQNYESESYKLVKELYIEAGFERFFYKTWLDMSNYMQSPLDLFNFTELANIKVSGNSYKGNKDYIIFDGIISKTPIKNNINSQILLIRNENWLKKIFNNTSNFEKYFSLYATNGEFLENILTEKVKENLVQIYEEFEIPFEISIKNNFIYIRIFTGSLFENTNSHFSVSNKEKLYEDYIILKTVMDMIKKINSTLNTTIELDQQ